MKTLTFLNKSNSIISSRLKKMAHIFRHGKKVFLIYTMGKVGSTTIYTQIKKKYPFFPIYHLHFLSDNWLLKILPKMDKFFHSNIKDGNRVKNELQKVTDHRMKIITLVREPMIREISDIFQNWKGLFGVNDIREISPEAFKIYLNNYNHEYVLNWFDTEFREFTGFDIYSQPFNKEKGYSIYITPKADILCIQLEKLNTVISVAIKEFANIKLESGLVENNSESKETKELYKELVKNFKVSEQKSQILYNSKYVQHFYSLSDIELFKKRWCV